ncbi:MAG: hypothetical protein V2I48_15720 [Xanthomonadales bacterium]|jgi:hypothetical protein|nr:hypothetical protein [Xanthomonadales bacterium]
MSSVTRLPRKLQVTQPAPISLEAIRKPVYAGKEVLMVWCEQTHFGGLYTIETGIWHTIGPLDDFDAFKQFMVNAFPEAIAEKH